MQMGSRLASPLRMSEALAKLDGLLQSWQAAVQDTQIHVTLVG